MNRRMLALVAVAAGLVWWTRRQQSTPAPAATALQPGFQNDTTPVDITEPPRVVGFVAEATPAAQGDGPSDWQRLAEIDRETLSASNRALIDTREFGGALQF